MSNYAQLIEQLNTQLEKFKYAAEDEIVIPNVIYISYVKNPQVPQARNLCALLDMPSTIKKNSSAKSFFKNLRRSLLTKYGTAFLWKELEMCFIVVCEHDIYQILEKDGGNAVSEAGFYLTSLMGTCFIDKTTFDHFNQSTWGIYFSGEHYKAVRETVAVWCEQQKKAQ